MFVKPAHPELKVFDPALKDYLPPHGRDVGSDNPIHWERRLYFKEVELLSDTAGKRAVEAFEKEQSAARAAEAKQPKT